MSETLAPDDLHRLARVVREPFHVYQPSRGGGRDWANLVRAGLVSVEDVGGEQETILFISATESGRAALSRARGGEAVSREPNERVLEDDYPVHAGFAYVADGVPFISEQSADVRRIKLKLGAKEIRNCDFAARAGQKTVWR